MEATGEQSAAPVQERRTIKIVVTGGRKYTDKAHVFMMLDEMVRIHGKVEIAEGGQRYRHPDTGEIIGGADYLAYLWARERGVPCRTYKADWQKFGNQAGPLRNSEMLAKEKPDRVLAFPGHTGTLDCVTKANRRKIKVISA